MVFFIEKMDFFLKKYESLMKNQILDKNIRGPLGKYIHFSDFMGHLLVDLPPLAPTMGLGMRFKVWNFALYISYRNPT
jgi:hypothetical protein